MLASIHKAVKNVAPNGGHHLNPAFTYGYYKICSDTLKVFVTCV